MPTLAEAIAPNLKRLREERNLSVDQVADKVGVARMSVYNYEKAKGGLTADMVAKFAALYGVDETDLVKPSKPAPNATLEEMIEFMRAISWTPTRLDVLRSVLTGFATAAEKRSSESLDEVRKPGKKRE